jgi:hypothetical protein
LHYGEVEVLGDGWSSAVHHLYEFPDSVVDDVVVFAFTGIVAKMVVLIHEAGVVDGA